MLGALGACGSQKEPAQLQLGEIEGTVSAASADASKYLPDRLQKVQDELNGLREEYQNKDYAAVVSGAPAVLNDAQALAAAASAAQADAVKALTEQWTRLSVSLPAEVTVLSIRIDALGKKSGKRQAAGIDLDAARAALADASSLWSKAQAAFASDNLREAVSTANTVGSKLESLAATLKLDLGTAS
jgi:hypothetical protein